MTEFIYKDDELKDVAKAQVQKDQDTSQPNQHIAAIITEVIYKDDEPIEAQVKKDQ
jgi:hypothetical protein